MVLRLASQVAILLLNSNSHLYFRAMRINIYLLFILFFLGLFFSNCKKGPEDPEFSIRTRKQRLTGEWSMKSGNASITHLSTTDPPFNQNLTFNGSKVELNETENSSVGIIYIFPYSLVLNIKRDGTFNFREMYGSNLLEANGRWNFEYGSGKSKNKEEVKFEIEEVTKGLTVGHVFNEQRTIFTYKLVQLMNKDLKIESLIKTYINANGDRTTYTNRYTFAQPL